MSRYAERRFLSGRNSLAVAREAQQPAPKSAN